MKLKNIILISLLLIFISLTAVSAADSNQTLATDDVVIDDNANMTLMGPDTVIKNDYEDEYRIEISNDVRPDGNLKASIDGKEIFTKTASNEEYIGTSVISKALGNNFGEHELTVGLYNDTHYKDTEKSIKFNYTYFYYNIENTVTDPSFNFAFGKDVKGTLTLTVDKTKYTETISEGNAYIYVDNLKYGKHTYKVQFTSKNTKNYKSFTHSGSFNYEGMTANPIYDVISYGQTAQIEVYLPWDVKNKVTVKYNGKTKTAKVDDEGYVLFEISDLKLGKNKLDFSYPKDKQYPAMTKTVYITVNEILNVTENVGYKSGEGVTVKLPADASGNISVLVDDVEKQYSLDNGNLNVDLSDYEMGSHTIKVNYTGDDYTIRGYEGEFKVVAQFRYLENVYYKDGVNLTLILPEDATGTFTAVYDHRFKKADVVNGRANLHFADIHEYDDLKFTLTYSNGNYDDFTKKVQINHRSDSPDSALEINMEKTILTGEEGYIYIGVGDDGEGYVNVTVDGKFIGNYSSYYDNVYVPVKDVIKNLETGNHTLKVDYSGDNYFPPKSNTTQFSIDYYRLSSTEIVMPYPDYFKMYISSDVTGTATLEINGKTIKGRYYVDEDEDYYAPNSFIFDLSKIPYGEYDAQLVYSGDKKHAKFTKNLKINVIFDASMDVDEDTCFGENTTLHFAFSPDIEKVNITVGDKTYTKDVDEGDVILNVSNSVIGKQIVTVTTFKTDKYPEKTFTFEYDIAAKIIVPERINIIDGGNITLTLPEDASGNLIVSVYDKGDSVANFTAVVENGFASVPVKFDKLGYYTVIAEYTGSDYNATFDGKFAVTPKLTYEHRLYVGETENITFEMPSDADGKLTFIVGDEKLNGTLKDGKAVMELPILPWIDDDAYYFYVLYEDPVYGNYLSTFDDSVCISRFTPNITVTLPKEIIANNYIKVTFTLPSDAKGYMTNNDDYVEVKNGKATLKFFIKKAGTDSYYYGYGGDNKYLEEDYWINITALPAPKLTMKAVTVDYTKTATMKVKVLDSYGKLVKGKYVSFYVNGKKVKSVKTDKKGYATIKLTKTPGTYNVKATYKGGVVSKKLTVKHLLTLKTVKVKKSKKLVLKVTLKKGKKALKYKKVTLKFNGKKYVKYTNKKGVAKLTIKKSVLKKLKVGKKVTYQATYLKDTVKKTAKVIK